MRRRRKNNATLVSNAYQGCKIGCKCARKARDGNGWFGYALTQMLIAWFLMTTLRGSWYIGFLKHIPQQFWKQKIIKNETTVSYCWLNIIKRKHVAGGMVTILLSLVCHRLKKVNISMLFLSKHAILFNLSLKDKKDSLIAAVMFVFLMHQLTEASSHQLSVSARHRHATLFHFLSELAKSSYSNLP